jgi:hypothetical protein
VNNEEVERSPKLKALVEGEVVGSEVVADTAPRSITKLMKVVSISRGPGGRIARIDMNLKAGPIELEIDEPTARAIVKVFDDDTARIQARPNVLDMQDELSKPDAEAV